jgi:hypothetical protein
MKLRIEKYSSYWAVYDNDNNLVCVTVYKKGAKEVLNRLSGEFGGYSGNSIIQQTEILKLGREIKSLNKRFSLLLKVIQISENMPAKAI